ncbi:hypothetical protein GCM10025873_13970 [Demequina sediminis]|nr:hypothetical protein GCM10025873_13970 [Demequina sediminis]
MACGGRRGPRRGARSPARCPRFWGQAYQVWTVPLDGTAAIAVSVEPWDPAEPERGSTTPTEVVAAVELA